MRALLDVNVLIALLDSDHSLHRRALEWFGAHAPDGWASCPITQNGCLRVMSGRSYPNPLPTHAVAVRLARACAHHHHEFWQADLSLLDDRVFDTTRIHNPLQLTDSYLLALAVARGGRLLTFDTAIGIDTIRGASRNNLLVI